MVSTAPVGIERCWQAMLIRYRVLAHTEGWPTLEQSFLLPIPYTSLL